MTPCPSRSAALLLLTCVLAAAPAAAGNFLVRALPNMTFDPPNLTIDVGDSVTFRNDGGLHNVRSTSGPETFACAVSCASGTPSEAAWEFTLTFNNAGTIQYQCDVHVGLGMVGTIVVEASGGGGGGGGGGEAGSVAFRRANFQTSEGAGTIGLGLERAGGDDGGVSVRVRSTGGTATADNDYTPVDQVVAWADGEDGVKSVDVTVLDDNLVESAETVTFGLSGPSGGVTIGQPSSATLEIADDDTQAEPCVASATTLCLGVGDRFRVEITWRDFQGGAGPGRVVDLPLRDTGLFYFFQPDNVEMNVKVLDACVPGLGNKYWVLFAASTNVAYTLTVTDTEASVTRTYENALGNLAQATIDIEAFDTCP